MMDIQDSRVVDGGFQHPSASLALSIQHWIRLAEELSIPAIGIGYVISSVNLATMLTRQLMRLISEADIAPADIMVDNVIIFADVTLATAPQTGGTVAVQAVHFQPGVVHPSAASMPSRYAHNVNYSRALCAALGNILLEIFSKGQSSSLVTSTSIGTTNSSHGTQNDNTSMPPSQKRKISAPVDDSISASVNSLLLETEMPLSIRVLVCDLLDAITEPCPYSALTSLETAFNDLSLMSNAPQRFLFDQTCPQMALEYTCLFQNLADKHLFGRNKELGFLMDAKNKFAAHVDKNGEDPSIVRNAEQENTFFGQAVDFHCDLVFLSGYEGIGKSSLLRPLINTCNKEKWFVLSMNFGKHDVAHIHSAAKAFDDFFGHWAPSDNESHSHLDPAMLESFHQVCHSLNSTIDEEGLLQLGDLIPKLRRVFPKNTTATKKKAQETSSLDKVGSAVNRQNHLIQVLLKALCSVGRKVLITCDDMQWSKSFLFMTKFIANYMNIPCRTQKYHQGVYIVGTYRCNEIGDDLIKNIESIEKCECTTVKKLDVGEISHDDVTQLLSVALCLPARYTQELGELVVTKTRGNPFFVIQFLRSIIQNNMLSFSVQSRRWEWDCDVVDMQMISDEVAELLTTRFNQLPLAMMDALKVVSCLGYQVEEFTIVALNSKNGILPYSMQDQLHLAIKEGLLEKAGPLYQFTHDIIQKTIYEFIPPGRCKLLHKTIGENLLKFAEKNDNNDAMYRLAVDQINIYCKDAFLSSEKRSEFASINATAAKLAIALSFFEQARCYIDVGMELLEPNRWAEQYSLSLDLYEMSASVSCFNGDSNTMSRCLNEIIANVKSFEDSLTSSTLLAKLLAASSKYDEAMVNCLSVLSALGEEFPQEISLDIVLNELSVIQNTLSDITVDKVKLLPPMTDAKLKVMEILSMLCVYSVISKPMLLPLLSCRMVRLMLEHGFCDDSIIGLVSAGWTLFTFTDKIKFGHRLIKVGESLIEERPNKSILLAKTCGYIGWLKAVVEPIQTVLCDFADRYNRGIQAGDIETAMLSRWSFCAASLYAGVPLIALSKQFVMCIQLSAKCQHNAVLYASMSHFRVCVALTGDEERTDTVEIKSYEEINKIGKRTNNGFLLYHNILSQMGLYFWSRDYVEVVQLVEELPPSPMKRVLESVRFFYQGIASICLARHTHQPKWRTMGEEAATWMSQMKSISNWNFENKSILLQAELHYLEGDLDLADSAYNVSIESAHEHRFIHEEALAYELYGIFCLENNMVEKGTKQLQMAIGKYTQWGAMMKVAEVRSLMELAGPTHKIPN